MDPTLRVVEPTPQPFGYSQEALDDSNIITRKEAGGNYDNQYGENDVNQGGEDEIFFNQGDFIDDDDGKCLH